jgi:CheY-like chemotaxis protein
MRRGGAVTDGVRGVLVVDVDPDIRAFVSEVLAGEGYEARAATNGLDALTSSPTGAPMSSCST